MANYVDPTDPAAAPEQTDVFRPKLQSAYKKYLGRDLNEGEGYDWYNNPNYERDIWNSEEAQTYRKNLLNPQPVATPAQAAAPTKTWDEEQFWRDLLGSGGKSTSDLTNFLNSSGYGTYVKQGGSKGDKITLPGGSAYDVVMAAGEGGRGFYKGSLDGAKDAGYAAATAPQTDPRVSDTISKLLDRGNTPVSETDPAIQAQFGATARTIDRGAQRARQTAAERGAQGGSLVSGEGGAFDATVNGIGEKATEQKGTLMAQLMADELQNRRQDVLNAMTLAQGEERNALQVLLANLNAELSRYGIDTNASLNRSQMGQQNQQFYDTLSWNMANTANSNNDLLRTILDLFR